VTGSLKKSVQCSPKEKGSSNPTKRYRKGRPLSRKAGGEATEGNTLPLSQGGDLQQTWRKLRIYRGGGGGGKELANGSPEGTSISQPQFDLRGVLYRDLKTRGAACRLAGACATDEHLLQ